MILISLVALTVFHWRLAPAAPITQHRPRPAAPTAASITTSTAASTPTFASASTAGQPVPQIGSDGSETLLDPQSMSDWENRAADDAPGSNAVRLQITEGVFSQLYHNNMTDQLIQPDSADESWLLGEDLPKGQPKVRPYLGDTFYSFAQVYWPIHCVICLAICTLGIFANVTNIIVLTRPNMITAVNTILSAMAFSDLIVNISNIPYLMHELSDSSNATSFYSYQWAFYILFHAHTSVTAHTISIWLTCVLATWRYCVVCRSQASNQRNWSTALAKRTITGVFLLVPLFCIPNYLSFAIVNEVTEANITIYKVGFSHLADESKFMQTFHFWIFSCLTKLVPCVLLIFFTTVLIRKLLDARERRLRLTGYGNNLNKDGDEMPNGAYARRKFSKGEEAERVIVNGMKLRNNSEVKEALLLDTLVSALPTHRSSDTNITAIQGGTSDQYCALEEAIETQQQLYDGQGRKSGPQMASESLKVNLSGTCEPEMLAESPTGGQQSRVLSQLIVESSASGSVTATTVSALTAPTKMLASCDNSNNNNEKPIHQATLAPIQRDIDAPRSASTCGALDIYYEKAADGSLSANEEIQLSGERASQRPAKLDYSSMTVSQDFLDKSALARVRRSLASSGFPEANINALGNNPRLSQEKRIGDLTFTSGRGRSVGGAMPLMSAKMHSAQRQISQNETTTRLLIAVMIVFLICELPAGILAALCAMLGQDFFENVYKPTGALTDLLALINSSVNFILYCFMSTQFRVTFYRVVLHCPAPNAPQHHQAMFMTVNTNTTHNNNNINNTNINNNSSNNNLANVNKDRSPMPVQQNRELNNY